jgi:hypothetical protein
MKFKLILGLSLIAAPAFVGAMEKRKKENFGFSSRNTTVKDDIWMLYGDGDGDGDGDGGECECPFEINDSEGKFTLAKYTLEARWGRGYPELLAKEIKKCRDIKPLAKKTYQTYKGPLKYATETFEAFGIGTTPDGFKIGVSGVGLNPNFLFDVRSPEEKGLFVKFNGLPVNPKIVTTALKGMNGCLRFNHNLHEPCGSIVKKILEIQYKK